MRAALFVLLLTACATPARPAPPPCLTEPPWRALHVPHLALGPDNENERAVIDSTLAKRRAWMIDAWLKCGGPDAGTVSY